MAKSKSSRRWLEEHRRDAFVREAQSRGLRSRASFKLEDIDRRDRLLRPGAAVVDLGAAPGGWSEYAAVRVQPGGIVVAVDLLAMNEIPGVHFVQRDLCDGQTLQCVRDLLGERKADLVLSDMAPNISGMAAVDIPRSLELAETAQEVAEALLNTGGAFLVKLFQGAGVEAFVHGLRDRFATVAYRKPSASRDRSREIYVLARNYHV